MWVQFLGLEDPVQKKMVTHSSILAWKIPWTEKPGGLQPMGSRRIVHDRETEYAPESIKVPCPHHPSEMVFIPGSSNHNSVAPWDIYCQGM